MLDFNQVSANASQGNGGNITIDTQGLFIDPTSKITASSEVEQKKGTVEINTLDLSSRLETDYYEQSPLAAENQINTGCGVGTSLAENQFRDLGRGGIPNNLLQETSNLETLADLGKHEPKRSNSIKQSKHTSELPTDLEDRPLTEANSWIINSRGVVELIAQQQVATSTQPSNCGLR